MRSMADIRFDTLETEGLEDRAGVVAIFATDDGKLDVGGRKVNSLTRKAVARLVEAKAFGKGKAGDVFRLDYPGGMAAEAVLVVKCPKRPSVAEARRAGAQLAKAVGEADLAVVAGSMPRAEEVAMGFALRAYRFDPHLTGEADRIGAATFLVNAPEAVSDVAAARLAVADGVHFARDLTNEPANVLTTTEFADRLIAMEELGLSVEVLEEEALAKLGMGALLAVGQGSVSPSKVVVMRWDGGGAEAPLALVGKGVVFDTGGISLKPASGMEEMVMDMGGAGVVAGTMRALARRKAKANVVGLVGLVENMPSGNATRPGDVVRSMKGDTIEVINTDAEGRLVLADVMWYAQERFKPVAMVDLATLTGAVVVALGHENAGVFSNNDGLAEGLMVAGRAEGEGVWRMPMGEAYDKLLKSRVADMKNVGGRWGGAIIAAQFLKRFVKDDLPWAHLDIAGVAMPEGETAFAPKGSSGWGVMTLDRFVADRFEG